MRGREPRGGGAGLRGVAFALLPVTASTVTRGTCHTREAGGLCPSMPQLSSLPADFLILNRTQRFNGVALWAPPESPPGSPPPVQCHRGQGLRSLTSSAGAPCTRASPSRSRHRRGRRSGPVVWAASWTPDCRAGVFLGICMRVVRPTSSVSVFFSPRVPPRLPGNACLTGPALGTPLCAPGPRPVLVPGALQSEDEALQRRRLGLETTSSRERPCLCNVGVC